MVSRCKRRRIDSDKAASYQVIRRRAQVLDANAELRVVVVPSHDDIVAGDSV